MGLRTMLAAICHEPKSVKYHLSHLTSIVQFTLFDQVWSITRGWLQTCPFVFMRHQSSFEGLFLVYRNSSGLYQGNTFTHNHTGMEDKIEPSSAFQNISSRLPQEKSPALNRVPKNTLEVKQFYFRVNSCFILYSII